MKFQHILQKVYHEPWLITPGGHAAIVSLVETRILNAEPSAKREGENYCGEKVEVDQMEIIDGVAHIPIGGVIGYKLTGFEKGMGAVDLLDVQEELSQAEANPMVKGIILDIDSPGGMVTGLHELAEQIEATEKTVFAFTDGLLASAAYWLASAADRIYATRSSEIGSIGVYIPWVDSSERYKQAGYTVKVIRSGKYKGMGYPGTPLTKDQESLLQNRVNSLAQEFYDQVKSGRGGKVPSEAMQGQTFSAKDSVENGLVDEIVHSKDEVSDLF